VIVETPPKPATGAAATARLLLPAYQLDLTGTRIDPESGDYVREDLSRIMGQSCIFDEAINLYRAAAVPTIAFCSGPGETRALCARLRIADVRARHIDDLAPTEDRRRLAAEFVAGRIDIVAVVNPRGAAPIPATQGIMMLRPTLLASVYAGLRAWTLGPASRRRFTTSLAIMTATDFPTAGL
jgi:hypothetical protein